MKNYKRIVSIVLLIAVTICSILPTGLEAKAADVTESNPMYRLYNPNSGEHFYTADEGEKDYLSGIGWNYEGIGWNAPVSSNSPVYRLYNPYSSDHHYTMDEGERDYLSQTGWNYEGIGWYSDDAKSVPLYRQFNPNEVIGTHNYTTSLEENDWLCTTGWQAEGIGWYGVRSSSDDEHENEPLVESEKSVDNYAVINLEVDQFTKSVNAKVGAPGNCKLLVRFVSEDVYFADGYYSGKEYINDGATQASCDVTASDEFVEVSSLIDNADDLPDNFVAEAVLVDANGNNLCSPYTSIENTRRHEEFEAKDIYSFEGHNVVNFDEDATTNFGVLEDDVKILTAEEVVEEVNEDESKNYTITSPSENIEVGDKVYIKDGTGEYLFKVAEKNTLSDGKIFVKAARANDANHGFKIEDFFTYIDYETDGYSYETNKKYSSNEKLAYEERTFTFNSPTLDAGAFEIDASISGTIGVDINIEVDKQVYGNILIVDYESTVSQTNEVTLTPSRLSKEVEYKKTLGKVRFPIVLIADAYVKVGLEFSGKISTEVSAEGTSTLTAGFHYDSVGGLTTSSAKDNEWDFAVKGELEIKMGPTVAVGVEVIAGVVAIEVEGFAGLVANATIEAGTGNDDHACTVCASGVLKARTELSLNLLLLDFGDDPYKPFEVTLIDAKKTLCKFYVSIVNPSGEIKFGKGVCPYSKYRWRQAYLEYLNSRAKAYINRDYCLIYVNDDDIPELVESYNRSGAIENVYLMSKDGELDHYGIMSLSGYFDYVPRGNSLYTHYNGEHNIWEIQDRKWVNVAKGEQIYNRDSEDWDYYFNDLLVSKEESAMRLAEAFGNGSYTIEDQGFTIYNPNAKNTADEKWYTRDELIKMLSEEVDF